jgi:AraC family transcriptional regulator, regulatory protein of adaptative response / DNA-3-methyladenine glycosylase II
MSVVHRRPKPASGGRGRGISSKVMNDLLPGDVAALDRARASRDPRFDGKFFIAVTSTGIYCRPICPVRSPKADHIRYFPTAAAAAEAGFRPCLRCRPEAAPGTSAWLGTSAVVRRALRLIDEGGLDKGSVELLADRLGIGPRHLRRLFVQHVGASPLVVAGTRRLHFAKRLLDETSLSITDVALAAGFGSVRRFNDAFRRAYRRPPRDLRRRASEPTRDRDEVRLKLAYRPPYDWDHVHKFLSDRAVAGLERVDAHGYARTVALGDRPALIHVRPLDGDTALELHVRGAEPTALFQVSSAARRMFDVAADPDQIAGAFSSDPLLGPLVKRHPGLRIPGVWDPFECVVRAVLGQQVSVMAGRTFTARLVARLGRPLPNPSGGLTHLFPTPQAIATGGLDGLGLTDGRINALQSVARAIVSGELTFDASPDAVVARLLSIQGVGEWTTQYIALRALGEPDAFPGADLILRRMAGSNGVSLSASALKCRAATWRPWRAYAVLYLWRAAGEFAALQTAKGA